VDEAVRAEAKLGEVMNGPTARLVECAELMVEHVAHADWAMFAKNGTDATTLSVTIARAATARKKILVARGSYHGIGLWSSAGFPGVPSEDTSNTIFFEYNDLSSVEAAVEQAGRDLAGIVATPFRHDILRDLDEIDPAFAQGLRGICDRAGAALILDDIRCGMRIDLAGSWEPIGVRPDLSAWSKAVANGQPLAAVLGSEPWREAAHSIRATGSFWLAPGPMAAAIATWEELRACDGIARMAAAGTRLRAGLEAQAACHGLSVTVSGPPQIPYMTFGDDLERLRANRFASECVARGVYLHPGHNWFMSVAHGDEDVDLALEATDRAFAAVAQGHQT
jgi:glutamate-1-semialdehyde 2,1-aminomutase